jgi:hypothetical protein
LEYWNIGKMGFGLRIAGLTAWRGSTTFENPVTGGVGKMVFIVLTIKLEMDNILLLIIIPSFHYSTIPLFHD